MKRSMLILTMCLLVLVGVGGYFWWASSSLPVGFLSKVFVDQNGQAQSYTVFVPYDYKPGQKRPLLLFLPHRTSAYSAIRSYFGQSVFEMKRTFPFVVAIPECLHDGWTGLQIDKAIDVMDQVAEDYATDPDRVYVTGVSAGGYGVWHTIALHPDRFAAAVPLCGGPSSGAEVLADVQIWSFCNSGDKAGLVESNRKIHQALLDVGASSIYTEYVQGGHNCWTLAYRNAGMYDWLLEQSRSKNARQTQRFKLLSADQMLATWESFGADGWEVAKDGSLSYKDVLSEQPGYLVSKKAYDACEFHFDLFLKSEASVCQLGLFDAISNDIMSGYTLTLLSTNMGTSDLVHSTNGWIASVDPAAQHQMQAGQWNDIRVHFGNGRISVRINGWRAIDAPMQENSEKPFHLAIISPDIKAGVQWRNARVRVPD